MSSLLHKSNENTLQTPLLSPWGGLMILIGLFLTMLVVVSLLSSITTDMENQRTALLISNSLQCVLVFIVPQLLSSRLIFRNYLRETGYSQGFTWTAFCGMLFIFIIGMPALNQIIFWNNELHFPDSLATLEKSFRDMENIAAEKTAILLDGSSLGSLISGILIIGVLTGLSEEIFFRAGVQRFLQATGMNPWWAIFIAALIFSALHFQFFGFVPRLILGAFFGYLYYMTGSIWLAACAHALNNSLVVIFTWLQNRGYNFPAIDTLGIDSTGIPVWAISSAVSVIIFLYFLGKFIFRKK